MDTPMQTPAVADPTVPSATTPAPVAPQPTLNFVHIPVSKVRPCRYQARKDFNQDKLQSLAESIKQEGLMGPVLVRGIEDAQYDYELIFGERRLRGCQLAGEEFIEAKVIQVVSEAEAAAKSMVENVQRERLNPIEEAEGFATVNRLDPVHWTHDRIAAILGGGRGRPYITNSLRLLDLPESIQEDVRRRTLSRSHALEVLRLPTSEQQLAATDEIIEKDLSQKAAKKLVDQILGNKASPLPSGPKEGGVDPLAKVWFYLTKDPSIAAQGGWAVKFGKRNLPDKGTVSGWNFWLASPPETPKAYLKQWLTKLLEAIDTEQDDARAAKLEQDTGPKDEAEFQKLCEEAKQVRLPKTEQEQAELEKLAAGGPGAVYAWLYGPESLHAQKAAATTWEDMDVTDPVIGCRQVVQSIKALKELDPEKITQEILQAQKQLAEGVPRTSPDAKARNSAAQKEIKRRMPAVKPATPPPAASGPQRRQPAESAADSDPDGLSLADRAFIEKVSRTGELL